MIVPPGICALACIWIALSTYTSRTAVKFDWTGFLALAVAIIAAQLVLDRGHRLDWYESPQIILLTFVGCLSFWIFAAHCLTAKEPFLNPRLLLDRNFAIGTIIAFVMGMLSFAALTLLPTLLSDLRGYPESVIGTLIAARGIGNWTAFFFITKLTRIAPRTAIGAGLAIQAVSGFWMASVDINLTEFDVFWTNYLLGLGQSVTFTPMTVLAFATLPRSQVTEGSAVFILMRNFGSSLFISICVLVAIRSSNINYAQMTERVTSFKDNLGLSALPDVWNPDTTLGLLRLSGEINRQASMIGYLDAFFLIGLVAAVAVPLAYFMKVPSLAAQE